MFLTKKFKNGGPCDILETFSKYNDKDHQNSKKNLSHYSFKIFYRTWVMYSKKKLMKTFFKKFPIFFQSSMGAIKFSVTFLVGPPICTSTHVIDLKAEV